MHRVRRNLARVGRRSRRKTAREGEGRSGSYPGVREVMVNAMVVVADKEGARIRRNSSPETLLRRWSKRSCSLSIWRANKLQKNHTSAH